MSRRVVSLLLSAIIIVLPGSLVAQWGRRFSVAAGPVVAISDTPPHAGVHLRAAGALAPGPRTLNLLADGYVTWLAPGSVELRRVFEPPFDIRERETQVGIGLSGLLNFLPQGSVSPYLLVGAVSRWSDASVRLTLRDDSGQVINQISQDMTEHQFDILLGLGTAIRWGGRRLLLEARLYGGTAINLPITVGLTL